MAKVDDTLDAGVQPPLPTDAPPPLLPIGNTERADMAQPYVARPAPFDLGRLIESLNPFRARLPFGNVSYEQRPTIGSGLMSTPQAPAPLVDVLAGDDPRRRRLAEAAFGSVTGMFQPEGEANAAVNALRRGLGGASRGEGLLARVGAAAADTADAAARDAALRKMTPQQLDAFAGVATDPADIAAIKRLQASRAAEANPGAATNAALAEARGRTATEGTGAVKTGEAGTRGNLAGVGAPKQRTLGETIAARQQAALEDMVRKGEVTPTEAAAFSHDMAPPAEPVRPILTAEGQAISPGKLTRAIQATVANSGVPLSQHPELADAIKAIRGVVPKDKWGGDLGAATQLVLTGNKAATDLFGPELTQKLLAGKVAQLARDNKVPTDTIARGLARILEDAKDPLEVLRASPAEIIAAGERGAQAARPAIAAAAEAAPKAAVPKSTTAKAGVRVNPDTGMWEVRNANGEVRGVGETKNKAIADAQATYRREQAGETVAPKGGGEPPPKNPNSVPLAQDNPKRPGFFHRAISELINFPRTLRATADVSQLLRQGLIPIVSGALSRNAERRLVARGAFVNALKGYGERYARETWQKAQADPYFSRWIESGGFESTIPVEGLAKAKGAKEEFFQSSLAEKIPGVRTVVKGSERSYGLTLNGLRFYTWKSAITAAERGGKALTPVEEKALARWLNIATGRGSLGDFSAASKVLNGILFAPRFAISRIQAVPETVRLLKNPETRAIGKYAAKDLAVTAVTGLSIMALADAAGLKVGWEPTSTDFGKIKVGNTSIDIWGGFEQPAVLVSRLVLDRYTDSHGVKTPVWEAKGMQPSWLDVLSRFAESKLGPTPSVLIALRTGKDFVGNAFGPVGGHNLAQTIGDIAGNTVIPLPVGDVVQAVQDLGLPTGLAVGALSAAGVGVQTRDYTPEEKSQNDLRQKWLNAPAFAYGNQTEWQAVYRTLKQYRELIKGKTAAQIRSDPRLAAFYNSAIGGRFRNYVTDAGDIRQGAVSQERLALQKDPNFRKLGITLDEIIANPPGTRR